MPIDAQGQIWVGKSRDNQLWQVCRGVGQTNESPKDTAIRVLHEVTGLLAYKSQLYQLGHMSFDHANNIARYYFYVKVHTDMSKLLRDTLWSEGKIISSCTLLSMADHKEIILPRYAISKIKRLDGIILD